MDARQNKNVLSQPRIQALAQTTRTYSFEKEAIELSVKLVKKKGKLYFVIDMRPSKAIRRAKKRIERRMREIQRHFGKEAS